MVRIHYVYTDGRTFTTEVMLHSEALAYMTVLRAQATTPNRYVTRYATIEIQEV